MQKMFEEIQKELKGLENAPEYDERDAVYNLANKDAADVIDKAQKKYANKFVGISVYEQVAWERDVAIQQLQKLGYQFGEDVENDDKNEKIWKDTDEQSRLYLSKEDAEGNNPTAILYQTNDENSREYKFIANGIEGELEADSLKEAKEKMEKELVNQFESAISMYYEAIKHCTDNISTLVKN